ncbi:hypothetical protein O7623_15370 [Solwaraspora sp. WMMD791]|uniref:hypothetical protein n=1 Tax=Solwaraspora sp. WMMD791 TaxID=3016086 RepID=UPI00249AB669|nr:hypothetical protein [Solwaraspora sp. WMMD791]WFE24820.1 hypothetical protein O7623_15370 [Solwaraspora sp. WMMD791]
MATPTVNAPTSPRRRRRVIILVTVATALLAMLGTGAALALAPADRPPATDAVASPCVTPGSAVPTASAAGSATVPTASAAGSATAPAASAAGSVVGTTSPDGGELSIVESGFTQFGSAAAPITRDAVVSTGAVIVNTSGHLAYGATVSFRVLDAEGRPASLDPAREQPRQIPVILPGQQVGVGERHWVASRGGRRVEVARVDVTVTGATWLPVDGTPTAAVTTRHLDTARYGPDSIDATVSYEVLSPYCRELTSTGAGIVFRDVAGVIVGGGFDPTASRSGCLPGRHRQSALLVRSLPPTADDTRTEVHQYCAAG